MENNSYPWEKGKRLKLCSNIVKLDLFIDDDRILRVGGRIQIF